MTYQAEEKRTIRAREMALGSVFSGGEIQTPPRRVPVSQWASWGTWMHGRSLAELVTLHRAWRCSLDSFGCRDKSGIFKKMYAALFESEMVQHSAVFS